MDFLSAANLARDKGLLDPDRPKIVCLCGSTRFCDAFAREGLRLTLEGKIVLSIGTTHRSDAEVFAGHTSDDEQTRATKGKLDALHFKKIELADSVLVLNVDGYVGESTAREIAHARKLGRPTAYLWSESEPCRNCGKAGILRDVSLRTNERLQRVERVDYYECPPCATGWEQYTPSRR